jgi:aspartate carbamoyltransferase regulatory subunit
MAGVQPGSAASDVPKDRAAGKDEKLVVSKIEKGVVIDHLPFEDTEDVICVLGLYERGLRFFLGYRVCSTRYGEKTILKIPDIRVADLDLNRIAVVTRRATVKLIEDYKVIRKINIKVPDAVRGIVRCPNPSCITNDPDENRTHPDGTIFYKVRDDAEEGPLVLRCHYCEKTCKRGEYELL